MLHEKKKNPSYFAWGKGNRLWESPRLRSVQFYGLQGHGGEKGPRS